MSSPEYIKNVAIVGASGQVGGAVLQSLLAANTFHITVITRQDSTSTFPTGVNVAKGDYASLQFLETALKGQDVLVLTFHVTTPPEVQNNFLEAAASAGVPWVLPNEYGGDTADENFVREVPIMAPKVKYRQHIEKLGKSAWIGVVCNLWIEYGLELSWAPFSIDIRNRKATLYDNGTNPVVLSTIPQVGRAVERLLSLPVHSTSGPSLSDYKNKLVYIRSLSVSPQDIVDAAQRATGTTPDDWTIDHRKVDDWIAEGQEKVKKGDWNGMMAILYGNTFKKGVGDQYHGRELANEKLGLPEEDLDDIMANVAKAIEKK